MTEKESFEDPEMLTILLLSGFLREYKEGAELVNLTEKTAKRISTVYAEYYKK